MGWGARRGLAVAALGVGLMVAATLQATVLPRVLNLRTSVSVDGTAAVTFEGFAVDECDAVLQSLSMHGPGGEITFQVETLSPCEHVLRPQTPPPNGTYCIETDYSGLQPDSPLCFDVTGVAPTLVGASLQMTTRDGLRSLGAAEDTCMECDVVAGVACTRAQQGWNVVLSIEGALPELASVYVFASVASTGAQPVTTLPQAPRWFSLGSDMTWATILPVPAATEQACVELYARAIGAEQSTPVGRACVMGGTTPTTLPAAPASHCGAAYEARWCLDNTQDCQGDGGAALPACQGYSALCEGSDAGTTEPVRDRDGGGFGTATDRDAGSEGARRDSLAGGVAPGGSSRGCGCTIVPVSSSAARPWLLLVALALVMHGRRRGR